MNSVTIRRNLPPALVGLLVGLLIGIGGGIAGLWGTSSTDNGKNDAMEIEPSRFYLVDFQTAQTWLEAQNSSQTEALRADLEAVSALQQATNLAVYLKDNQESIDKVLALLYQALTTGRVNNPQAVMACIGVDNDPFSPTGPGLYVYVEVPASATPSVPSNWQALQGPKEDNMLWSKDCYNG
jgi:hypothetical protein